MGVALSVGKQKDTSHEESNNLKGDNFLMNYSSCINAYLHKCIISGDIDGAQLALQQGADVNSQNQDGNTALHLAAVVRSLEMVQLLVEGVSDEGEGDVNIGNKGGFSPFHICIINNNTEIVKYMLDNGAEVLGKSADGKTPLELAILYKNKPTAQLIQQFLEVQMKDVLEDIEDKQNAVFFINCMKSFYGADLVSRYQRDIHELRKVLQDIQLQVDVLAADKRELRMGSNIQALDKEDIIQQQKYRQQLLLQDFETVNTKVNKQIDTLEHAEFFNGDQHKLIKQQLLESQSINAQLVVEKQQLQQTIRQLYGDMGRITDELSQLKNAWIAISSMFKVVQEVVEQIQEQVIVHSDQKVFVSAGLNNNPQKMGYGINCLEQFDGDGHSCASSTYTEMKQCTRIQHNLLRSDSCMISRESSMEVANLNSFYPVVLANNVCDVSIYRGSKEEEVWSSGQLTPRSPILLECDSDNSSATEICELRSQIQEVLEQNGVFQQELESMKQERNVFKQQYMDAFEENQALLERIAELVEEREQACSQNQNLQGEIEQMKLRICEEGVSGRPSLYKELSKQYNRRINELQQKIEQLQMNNMQENPEVQHVATDTHEFLQTLNSQMDSQHQQEVFGLNKRIEELESQCSCLQEEKQLVVEDLNSQINQLKTKHTEQIQQINCQQIKKESDQNETCKNFRKLTVEYEKISGVNKNILDKLHATEKDVENLRIYNDSLVLRIKKGNNDLEKAEIEQRKLQRFCWKSGEALDIAEKEKKKLLYSLECLSKEKKYITELPMYREVQCKNQRRENWLKQLVKKIGSAHNDDVAGQK